MITRTPLDGVELVLADLDGVVYRSAQPIAYAVESINAIAGKQVAYITNNASRTDDAVAAHLTELGLRVSPDDVVTSPQAAAAVLRGIIAPGATILVVGGEGLIDELQKAGYVVTRSAEDSPAAVVQGFAPDVAWVHLAEAAFALKGGDAGIPWIATNTDWTIPQARGTAPGNGTLVSAVHTAVGRLPIVAGKPETAIFEEAFTRYNSRSALMIGDRLDTDILGANRAGIPSLLVLTGIDQAKQVLAAIPEQRPTMILDDLRGLHEPYPETVVTHEGAAVITTVGTASVRLENQQLTVTVSGTSIDRLRAGASTIWNSGGTIYALDVAAEIYS